MDDAGVAYTLSEEIARGGQGRVYRVLGHPDLAIKLLDNDDPERVFANGEPREFRSLAEVRRLPLDGLAVAPPLTLIRDGGYGYVMRLASEMRTLRNPYLPSQFGSTRKAPWYVETGGLRRRLALLARVAEALAGLHARGMAYVDLNPNNVMASEDLSRDETWLIDTDNLTSRSRPRWSILGFPGYLAPERRQGAPPTTLSDAYSLAVMTFSMLVLEHPYRGTATLETDGQSVDTAIAHGLYPYVAHPDDDTNRLAPKRLPANLLPIVLSGRLRALAERTFVSGLHLPDARPGASAWREVLHTAYDNVIDCPGGCGWSYYRNATSCPSCGAATETISLMTVYGGDFEQPLPARDTIALAKSRPSYVLPRHLWGRYEDREPVLEVHPEKKGFAVTTPPGVSVLDHSGKRVVRINHAAIGKSVRVVIEVPERPARVLAFRSVSAT